MKPVSDYFIGKPLDVKYDNGYNVVINRDELLNILRQIQIDTIRETVQACADSVMLKFEDDKNKLMHVIVNKSSILEVADKLIKELE
jgi:hypothetical protein